MILAIFIAIFSLIILVVLHELGHFLLAKKFGVRVDEFGIGFPPRLFGKKIGKTLYSINLLPLGAFVKIYGEEGGSIEDFSSLTSKPAWQRALIILGGVLVFWLVAIILLSIVTAVWGLPVAVSDEQTISVANSQVQILEVLEGSAAQKAGFLAFDIIKQMEDKGKKKILPNKIQEVQEFIQAHQNQPIFITVQRGGKEKTIEVIPNEEGKIGVGLVRVGFQKSSWYNALYIGAQTTGQITWAVLRGFGSILAKIFRGEKVKGIEYRGPIGIGELIAKSYQIGLAYFLYFLALISIYLAIFNLLPIPAVDGGRLLFLGIEKIRGRPINPKIEQRINAGFFVLIIGLLIFVTIKDITRLF